MKLYEDILPYANTHFYKYALTGPMLIPHNTIVLKGVIIITISDEKSLIINPLPYSIHEDRRWSAESAEFIFRCARGI